MQPVRWSRSAFAAGILALAVAGCGDASDPRDAVETPPAAMPEIREPRVNLVPGGLGALYLSIVNAGAEGDRLVAVETAAADAAEIHETVRDGGVMRMVARPDGFEIPPRSTVELAPGGKHVMLIEPRPGPENTIRLRLRFENAGVLEIDAPVTGPGAANDEHRTDEHQRDEHQTEDDG